MIRRSRIRSRPARRADIIGFYDMCSERSNPFRYIVRAPPSQIGYLNAVVESMEGAMMLRTRDPNIGMVEFWVSRAYDPWFHRLIGELRREFPVQVREHDREDWDGVFEENRKGRFAQYRGAGSV